jgi:hypothetical protein
MRRKYYLIDNDSKQVIDTKRLEPSEAVRWNKKFRQVNKGVRYAKAGRHSIPLKNKHNAISGGNQP